MKFRFSFRTYLRTIAVKDTEVKAWFPYDLQRSAIGLRSVCDTIADRSAPRRRHMKICVPGVCGDLRHTVWMIGKVESSFTFPTVAKLPTKTFFNGNACLRIGETLLFALKHVQSDSK